MYEVLTPDELQARLAESGPDGVFEFHPLMGGLPPEFAWRSLRLFEREVLPGLELSRTA